MVIAAVAGIGLIIALVYLFRDQIGDAFSGSEEEKAAEAEKARQRDEKGALGNTIDWLFGEGTAERAREERAAEREAGQRREQERINAQEGAPNETTPWEGVVEFWDNNVAAHFRQEDAANPPAPPATTQGPPALEVEPVVHDDPPTEARPQGTATRGGAGAGRAGRG